MKANMIIMHYGRMSTSEAERAVLRPKQSGEVVISAAYLSFWLVTVVGGDEKQMKLDDNIRSSLRSQFHSVTLEFRHTGWNSNHGDQLKAMEPLLGRSDAVVVMRRIRTNLGNLRRTCPLWVGCAGDSRSSIERAIRLAVELARAKKSRN
jgi:hypothetical protein